MRLKERKRMPAYIPTSSMSDIAFLLIIFFMLTTVFRKELGLKVILPQAKQTERILKSRSVANVYIDKEDRVSVDDKLLSIDRVRFAFTLKVTENPGLVAQVKADKEVQYGLVSDILDALREAEAFKVVFATEYRLR
jgi:biopolymer transport protein ExbD